MIDDTPHSTQKLELQMTLSALRSKLKLDFANIFYCEDCPLEIEQETDFVVEDIIDQK